MSLLNSIPAEGTENGKVQSGEALIIPKKLKKHRQSWQKHNDIYWREGYLKSKGGEERFQKVGFY